MKLGFTGSQDGMTLAQKVIFKHLLEDKQVVELHHGDCIGADSVAHDIASSLGIYIVGHPPTNPLKRAFKLCDELRPEAEYLVRNHHIVNETDELIATPSGFSEVVRSGTWATVRYARSHKRKTTIIWPDGTVLIHTK